MCGGCILLPHTLLHLTLSEVLIREQGQRILARKECRRPPLAQD